MNDLTVGKMAKNIVMDDWVMPFDHQLLPCSPVVVGIRDDAAVCGTTADWVELVELGSVGCLAPDSMDSVQQLFPDDS